MDFRNQFLIGLRSGGAEGEGDRPEIKIEQAVAVRTLDIIVPLRRCPRDQLDLACIEAEPFIRRALRWLLGPCIGEEDTRRGALDQARRNRACGDVRQALRREHDRDILLAQRLQPVAQAACKHRMIEEQPGLIEDKQGRPAIESAFQLRKEMCQHRRREPLVLHQRVHFETEDVSVSQTVLIGVEQRAVGSGERIGLKCLPEFRRLDQGRKPGECALRDRCRAKALQRRPDGLFDLWCDGDVLLSDEAEHPSLRFGEPSFAA